MNALALVAKHPEDVRILVAHEPPLASILPDSENAKAAVRAISNSYQQKGWGAGMAHFIAIVAHKDEFPDDIGTQPGPDPQLFGMPADDDGSRSDVMLGQNIITCTHYEPDVDALRAASTRIVLAAGAESRGDGASRRGGRGRTPGDDAGDLPERSRRVPRRRVRPDRQAGRIRRQLREVLTAS